LKNSTQITHQNCTLDEFTETSE